MTKKATRRIIRKKIAQRKAKTGQNTRPNNSIRSQIMNIAAQNMANGIRPFGYSSQQYGNINNERRIEQLRNDSNLKSSELQNTNAIIENMQKEIKDLSADLASAKKEKKKIKAEHDKAEHDKEMAEDVLNENKRLEMDNDRLLEKKRSLERQNALVDKDIHIGELKKDKIAMEANLHQQQLEAIEKQKQIEANTIFNENLKLQNELDRVIAENAAYEDILKSEAFKNPNKEYIEKTKQLHLAKEENRQKQELYKRALENKHQQEELSAMPTVEELDAMAKQFADQTIQLRNNEMALKQQNIAIQDQIDLYDFHHEQFKNAAKDEFKEQYKLNILTNQNAYLQEQMKKTNANKRYNAQIKRTAQIRMKNERQAEKLKINQELYELKKKNDIMEKMIESKPNELTQDEQILTKSIGEEKARNIALKKKQQLKEDLHESELKKSEEQANNDFRKTDEYKDYLNDNINIKIETQKNLNNADNLKTRNELEKQLDRSKQTFELTNKILNADVNDVDQLDYHLKAASNLYDNLTKKDLIVKDINDKKRIYPEQWEVLLRLQGNENVNETITGDYSSINDLKDIYDRFVRFVKTPQLPMRPPPFQQALTYNQPPQEYMYNDTVDIGHFNDEEES